tara:strand:- start:136 stop:444 length:309 start_codon:yes stop_codon:yes gene_type:complete
MAKFKVGQSLGENMVALPTNVGLASDQIFMLDGYAKVRFPVNDFGKRKGIGSERMWVKITEGDNLNGVGILENEPSYSDFKLHQKVRYKENEDGFPQFQEFA